MIMNCKKCGKDMTSKINQMMINEIILSGRKYIHSDGTQAKYQEISITCEC